MEIRCPNIGTIGFGLMRGWHANAARSTVTEISSVTDTNIEASMYLVDKYPDIKGFSSVEERLDKMEIDVIHMCTPLATHVNTAELTIESGANLVLEKPITQTFEEADQILKQGGDINKIKGISLKINGTVIHNQQRGAISDLDTLPFPANIFFKLYFTKKQE